MSDSAIKGACVRSVLDLLHQEHSLEPILSGLAQREREIFSGGIVTAGWYPIESYLMLLDQVVQHHQDQDLSFCYRLGRKVVADGLGTIYRIFVKLSTPTAVLKRAPMLWGMYFQGSVLEIFESAQGSVKLAVRESNRVTAAYCMSRLGGIHETLIAAKAQNPLLSHPECRASGATRCLFDLRWKEPNQG